MSVPILIINWFISKTKLNKKKILVMLSFMYRTVSRGSVRKQIKYTWYLLIHSMQKLKHENELADHYVQ